MCVEQILRRQINQIDFFAGETDRRERGKIPLMLQRPLRELPKDFSFKASNAQNQPQKSPHRTLAALKKSLKNHKSSAVVVVVESHRKDN